MLLDEMEIFIIFVLDHLLDIMLIVFFLQISALFVDLGVWLAMD